MKIPRHPVNVNSTEVLSINYAHRQVRARFSCSVVRRERIFHLLQEHPAERGKESGEGRVMSTPLVVWAREAASQSAICRLRLEHENPYAQVLLPLVLCRGIEHLL